ncbi:MAG: ABC transporter ATP-binding protein, partial [Gloeobacteraceae cyanobacterium ES-bin-144]|nr:ABC transporter ATP-binding protein [Verrucomicrobiales bacterium]
MAAIDPLLEEELAERPMSGALLSRLLGYLRPHRRSVLMSVTASIGMVVCQLLGPRFIQLGIDRHLTNIGDRDSAMRGLLAISGVYLASLALTWLFSVTYVRQSLRAGQGAINDLREAVFRHIQALSLSYFDRTHQGRIIARADSDMSAMQDVLTNGLNQLVTTVLTLLGVLVLMLGYDWRLCAAVSIILPMLFGITWWFRVTIMRAYRLQRVAASRITASVAENVNGIRVVQGFARQEKNFNSFQALNREHAEYAFRSARVFHTYMPGMGILSGLGTTIILGYGGWLALQKEITPGELAAFIMYLGMFFGPVQVMGELLNQTLSAAASAERVFQLLDTDVAVTNQPGAVALPNIQGRVRFESVSFRYDATPEDRWILDDIDFAVEAGQTIALVGATGSGKSSIINLLARFYEPQLGRITVDEMDLREVTIASLHAQIGIVTQENFLFTGTVMENLKFGRPQATDEEVFAAARKLGTDAILLGLEEGYLATVSERGANFSAGERQLICFTRAMVAEPRILILDEATS